MNHTGGHIYELLEPEDYAAAKRALGLLPERFKQDIEGLEISPVKLPIEGGRGLALRLEQELAKHRSELATPEGVARFFEREIELARKGQRTPIDEITGALLFRTRRTREAHQANGVEPEMLTLTGRAVREEQLLRQHRELAEGTQQSAAAMQSLVESAASYAATAKSEALAAVQDAKASSSNRRIAAYSAIVSTLAMLISLGMFILRLLGK